MESILKSPIIEQVHFANRHFFVQRDDTTASSFTGNKAWKLYHFLRSKRYSNIHYLLSFGSMQSNAMYALSLLAKMRGWEFIYYTRINEDLLQSPQGNLLRALQNGMKIEDIATMPYDKKSSSLIIQKDRLFIPEGIRVKEAQEGIALLAKQIESWSKESGVYTLILPSGTGTTALYLQRYLSHHKVVAIPCVGGGEYLQKQFCSLEPQGPYPTIVEPPQRYRFARLYKELFFLWRDLKEQTGIEFDLLYDPVAFCTILSRGYENFLYIHQGGVEGNETMIARYKAKFGTIA